MSKFDQTYDHYIPTAENNVIPTSIAHSKRNDGERITFWLPNMTATGSGKTDDPLLVYVEYHDGAFLSGGTNDAITVGVAVMYTPHKGGDFGNYKATHPKYLPATAHRHLQNTEYGLSPAAASRITPGAVNHARSEAEPPVVVIPVGNYNFLTEHSTLETAFADMKELGIPKDVVDAAHVIADKIAHGQTNTLLPNSPPDLPEQRSPLGGI